MSREAPLAPTLTPTMRLLIGSACLSITLVFMHVAADFINSIALAMIIAVSASPLLNALRRRGLHDVVAYALTISALVCVVLFFLGVTAAGIYQLADSVPQYQLQLRAAEASALSWLANQGIDAAQIGALYDLVDPVQLVQLATGVALGLIGTVSSVVLLLLTAAFLLVETFDFPVKVERQIQLGNHRIGQWISFGERLREYVMLTARLGALAGIMNTLLLLFIGVDFALLWGILSFVLSFIPTLGYWIALIPPTTLAWLQLGWPQALAVFVGYAIVNTTVDNFLRPRLMGRGLGLAPSVVFLAVLLWTLVLGPLGAILAVPLTMAIKELVLGTDDKYYWVADLMSSSTGRNEKADQEANEIEAEE